ncbi:MAG TPA: hypothetical protein ENH65_07755 [Candidatus Aminicenantes bacterium]|nr:hypothetical protein [Candidatus Aminicenantes bacterium]
MNSKKLGIFSNAKIIEKGKLAVKESMAPQKLWGRKIQGARLASHQEKMLIFIKIQRSRQ